jgi:hypothetical protein
MNDIKDLPISSINATIHRLDIQAQYYEVKKNDILEQRMQYVNELKSRITDKTTINMLDPPLSSNIVTMDDEYFRYIVNGCVFDATKSWQFVNNPTTKSYRCARYTDNKCKCNAWHIGEIRDIPKDSLTWAIRKNDKERMQFIAAILTMKVVS